MLSRAAGVDILVDARVEGTVESLQLRDTGVEEVLDALKETCGIHWEKRGPVYVVCPGPGPPPPKPQSRTEQWIWDTIALRYAGAAETAWMFGGDVIRKRHRPHVYPRAAAPHDEEAPGPPVAVARELLPPGMEPPVAIPEDNVLIVHGTQEAIDVFREILAFFDKPAKQVEIEAKFVEVKIEEGQPSALDWFVANGSLDLNPTFAPGQGISMARFRRGRFESELRRLLDEGRAEVVNAPRVTTGNNVPATVSFTREIPWVWATISYDEHGNRTEERHEETVSLRDSLKVTPCILEDNSIILDLEVKIQERLGTEIGPDGEVVPVVSTRSAYTRVRVADGDTIVIGGLTRTTEVVDPKQVVPPEETAPTEESERPEMRQTELLLFVTPRIIREIPQE